MYQGCLGDDFTGSSDLGKTLPKAGMRVVQYFDVPDCLRQRQHSGEKFHGSNYFGHSFR